MMCVMDELVRLTRMGWIINVATRTPSRDRGCGVGMECRLGGGQREMEDEYERWKGCRKAAEV